MPSLDVFVSQPRPLVDPTQALLLLKWQLRGAVVLTALALSVSTGAAMATGMGAGIAVAGNAYFALQAFRHAGAQQATDVVRSFYRGEAGKFVITVLLFAAVFAGVKPLQAGWLLTGFILEQFVSWGLVLARTTDTRQ
ncbi:MAG: synthase chain [Moraxellaceae bacterium]|nr:synthase chain [Moraxellaceae bacterium]